MLSRDHVIMIAHTDDKFFRSFNVQLPKLEDTPQIEHFRVMVENLRLTLPSAPTILLPKTQTAASSLPAHPQQAVQERRENIVVTQRYVENQNHLHWHG